MNRDQVLSDMVAIDTAVGALRLKRHRLVAGREGVTIVQPNKPDLLLTYAAAKAYAQQIEEACQ